MKMKFILLTAMFVAGQNAAYAVGSGEIFTYDENGVPGVTAPQILQADSADFSYNARIVQANTGGGNLDGDAFTEAGFFSVSSFNLGVTSNVDNLNSVGGYQLYGVFEATGTAAFNGVGISASFLTGGLQLFLDVDQNTTLSISDPGVPVGGVPGQAIVSSASAADDILLGTADLLNVGDASLAAGTTLADGDFELIWGDWLLTSGTAGLDGDEFFVAPNPFYSTITFNGNTTTINPVGSITDPFSAAVDGSGNLFFNASAVPEPNTIALLGLGLLGIGFGKTRAKRS